MGPFGLCSLMPYPMHMPWTAVIGVNEIPWSNHPIWYVAVCIVTSAAITVSVGHLTFGIRDPIESNHMTCFPVTGTQLADLLLTGILTSVTHSTHKSPVWSHYLKLSETVVSRCSFLAVSLTRIANHTSTVSKCWISSMTNLSHEHS